MITVNEHIDSANSFNQKIYAGEVEDDNNSEEVRIVLLVEMIIRTIKQLIRHYTRELCLHLGNPNVDAAKDTLVYILNLITGSGEGSEEWWENEVTLALDAKYGPGSLTVKEATNITVIIEPHLTNIVLSLLDSLGFTITRTCEESLEENPKNFVFSVLDIDSCLPIVYHSIHLLEYAQGKLLVKMAEKKKNTSYPDVVLSDKPFGYWKLDDLAGSKFAHNVGPTGTQLMGNITQGVAKQIPCTLCNISQQNNVAFGFNVANKTRIDYRYNDNLNPLNNNTCFSIECWAKAKGGENTKRVILCTGRYCLYASKFDNWCCNLTSAVHLTTITLTGPTITYNEWTHLFFTYDGTMAKLYVNSVLVASVYSDELFKKAVVDQEYKLKKRFQAIDLEEEKEAKHEIDEAKEIEGQRLDQPSSKKELEVIAKKLIEKRNIERKRMKERNTTQTKLGRAMTEQTTKKAAEITESAPDHVNQVTIQNEIDEDKVTILESIDVANPKEKLPPQLLMGEALRLAKEQLLTQLESSIKERVHEKYEKMKQEEVKSQEVLKQKAIEKLKIPLCIGAQTPSKNEIEGTDFYEGELCHVAIYTNTIDRTHIKQHYVMGTKDNSTEVGRFYKLASDRFKLALRKVPNDKLILDDYAKALCAHYSLDATRYEDQSEYKADVMKAIHFFYDTHIEDGIAALLDGLPADPLYCDVVYEGYFLLMKLNSHYYDDSVERLGKLPEKFMLLSDGIDPKYSEVGASMIQNVVCINPTYYGRNTSLDWVNSLTTPRLVTHIIHTVIQGMSLRDLELPNMPDISVHEIDILSNNLHGIEHLNLSGCNGVSEESVAFLAKRCQKLESLVLDNCPLLNDICVQYIANLHNLRNLSLEKCSLVSDEGVIPVVQSCQFLEDLNLNNMRSITDLTLDAIGKNCSMLKSLKIEVYILLLFILLLNSGQFKSQIMV